MPDTFQPPEAPDKPFFKRFRRLLPYVRPAVWPMAGGLLAGVAFALLTGAGMPLMVKAILPVIFEQESEMNHPAPQKVIQFAQWLYGPDYRDKLLLLACFVMPAVFFVRGICAFLNRYLMNRAGFVFLDALQRDVFGRLMELPLAFYQRHKSGDLTSRLTNDASQLKLLVINIANDVTKQPLVLISAVGYLLYECIRQRSAIFTLVGLLSVPLCVLPIRYAARKIRRRAKLVAKQGGDLAAVVTEALQSPLEIQAYNLQDRQRERFSKKVKEIFRHSMKKIKYMAISSPIIEFVAMCGFMIALYFGVRGGMGFSTFSSLSVALFMAYEPVKKISVLHAIIKSKTASLERLEEVLDAEDTVASPVSPRPLTAQTGNIVFDDVTFNYPSNTRGPAALSEVSVVLRPGETVALVGASGAGKSTFTLLIPRFYDPTRGRVTFCGEDLRDLDKMELRSRIAIVPQMPVLFHENIAENIRVGRAGATDAEVREAARKAFIADFIESLPQGYETLAGERGTMLSGGQRQRIAIARAFLKDAPILLLDEAMSALDSESEDMIRVALHDLVQGRTTIMIAHRFSSITMARRVLVFENGRITGDGPADILSQTHTTYRRMADLQRMP